MIEYYEREMAALLTAALREMPVIVLTGMRQTGKTTLLRRERGLDQRVFFSLDDFAQLEHAKYYPDGFIGSDKNIKIDEVHKCPEIQLSIKNEHAPIIVLKKCCVRVFFMTSLS